MTEAEQRAKNKYNRNNYESIKIRFRKDTEEKKEIDSHAKKMNETTSDFIRRAIRETIKNDEARKEDKK